MIKKTKKVEYKLKDVKFENGMLVNKYGELIDLINELKNIFDERPFVLNVTYQDVSEYEVNDFVK